KIRVQTAADLLEFLFRKYPQLDPNVRGQQDGRTPLHHALLKGGNVQAARILLKNGAMTNVPDAANFYPHHYLMLGKELEEMNVATRTGSNTHWEIPVSSTAETPVGVVQTDGTA
ncbi:unnamed protein product, partial [Amoebophrya sp. A120]